VKFHDTKNKLLFERLTDQFSGGEIEENFFSGLSDLMKNPEVRDAEEKLAYLKRKYPDRRGSRQADNAQDVLKSQAEKLEQFANQTLMLLHRSGIDKEEQIFKDIVKSMNDAIDSSKVTGTEVSSATDSPQSDEQNQNYKENIAKIEKSQYGERISTFNKNLEPKLANLDNEKLMNFFQANLLRPMESMMQDNDLDPGMVVSDARDPAGGRMKISTAVENLKNLFKKLAQAGAMKDQKEIYNHLQAVPNIGKLGLRNSAKKITDALIQNLPSGLELVNRPDRKSNRHPQDWPTPPQ